MQILKPEMTILIADDDADDRALFIEAVREIDQKIKCVTANDGQRALNLLQKATNLPDFIFLDLHMPRFSGKKCLLEIKKDPRLKNIPLVIYTTSREVGESKEMKDLGAVYFISKPSNPEEIYYVVSFVLEEQLNISRHR